MSINIFKLQNGNVEVQNFDRTYSLNPDCRVYKEPKSTCGQPACEIKDKHGAAVAVYKAADVVSVTRKDGTVVNIGGDLDLLYSELSNFFFFKLGGSGGSSQFLGSFDDYDDLTTQFPTATVGDLAYVINSQGTWWLPGSYGGNFYSKGHYYWNGLEWDSAVDEIAKQLEDNTNAILSLQTALTNHVNDLNNPHDTSLANLIDTVNINGSAVGSILTHVGGDSFEMLPPAVGVPTFNEITWDVTADTLPITSTSVDVLNIDFDNFNGNIDLTGQLPTNLKVGARVVLRKIDTKGGRILFDDGVISYNFINKKGEYLTLFWNGTKYII
jgi:hypothetical protein